MRVLKPALVALALPLLLAACGSDDDVTTTRTTTTTRDPVAVAPGSSSVTVQERQTVDD